MHVHRLPVGISIRKSSWLRVRIGASGLYVCMNFFFGCMYIRMYVCMYIHTYVCIYIRMYVCMYVCMIHTYYVLINPPMPYITSSPLCLLRVFTSCLNFASIHSMYVCVYTHTWLCYNTYIQTYTHVYFSWSPNKQVPAARQGRGQRWR